jgi:7-cyano-7-deazaguanine synthase in queuosine biosynthesis
MTPATKRVLCGEAATGVRTTGDTLCLRNVGAHRDVHLQIDDISRALTTSVPYQMIDLIEIATFVYVADQFFPRGGHGVEDMGANWRRPLHFEIPVRCIDLWRRDDVATTLRDTLSFLSEDEYTFTFRKYQKPPALEGYLNFSDVDCTSRPQQVVLFSGGLDSLGGAVTEVVIEGRPVALVHHQATTKLINRHRMLRDMLDARAKGPKPIFVTIRINKRKNLNHEYTQRTRSFLYASLATTIARMSGLNSIRFYENGTVSLNLPIAREVVGAKATRTTHPRVLAGFSQLFTLLTENAFSVDNGFLWKTKEDVLRAIVDAGCGGMIEWSTSCAHTWEMTNEHPHCGTCSQCIDRRFAILAAGAANFEQTDSYAVDLLTGARAEGEARTMLASYVEVAAQVSKMSEMEFFMRFGEVARIVRHLGGSADQNARQVYDLHRRHARTVLRVIDEGLAQCASQIRSRSLPEGSLLRMVHDPSVAGSVSESPVPKRPTRDSSDELYVFRRRGDGWQLRFAGHELMWLRPLIGFCYIGELLRFPGKRFTLSGLLVAVHGCRADLPLGNGGELLDVQARVAYKQRLQELDEEIDESRKNNDPATLEKHEADRDRIRSEINKAWFRKRSKRGNSDLNRVRNSVCNAIRRAFQNIKEYEPDGAKHLTSSTSLGFSVIYNPAEPVPWSL